MKIFQVLCGKTWGGGSVVVHAITKRLIERGDEVWVFSFEEESDRRFREIGAKLARPPIWVDEISPLDAVIFGYLWNLCRREKFDLVATHTSKGGFLGRFAARLANVPCVVHHAHGFSFNRDLSALSKRFYVSLERAAARANDLIISVNEQHRRMAVDLGVEKPERICAIPNGIDVQPFLEADGSAVRRSFGFADSDTVIGTIGRLCPQKGLCYLIPAFKEALRYYPSIRLVVAGTGPLEGELREQVTAADLDQYVRFLGFRRDVPELLAAFDIYAQPSLWEGHSISLLEALAAGKVILATDIDGNREAVENGRTALMVSPANSEALAVGLRALLSDPIRAREMAARARQAALEQFTQERMVRQNISAYDTALANRRSVRGPMPELITRR